MNNLQKQKKKIEDSLSKLLSADTAIAENSNSIIDNYVIEKIKNNKEASTSRFNISRTLV